MIPRIKVAIRSFEKSYREVYLDYYDTESKFDNKGRYLPKLLNIYASKKIFEALTGLLYEGYTKDDTIKFFDFIENLGEYLIDVTDAEGYINLLRVARDVENYNDR